MFARGSRSTGRHARDDRSRRRRPETPGVSGAPGAAATPATAGGEAAGAAGEPHGPYDSAGAPPGRRLDLGSLKIPSVSGVEVRVQANQDGSVQQVFLVHGESMLQLGAFAAPRTEPIWDEVRDEIRQSLFRNGVATEEVPGEYGTELRARVRTPEGLQDLRFVGVSGPRWLLRAVFRGPAAVAPAQVPALLECLRGVVVERGADARPTREPLPLRLSEELAEQLPSRAGESGSRADATGAAGGAAWPGAAGPGAAGPGAAEVNGARPPGAGPDGAERPRRKPSPRPRRDGSG